MCLIFWANFKTFSFVMIFHYCMAHFYAFFQKCDFHTLLVFCHQMQIYERKSSARVIIIIHYFLSEFTGITLSDGDLDCSALFNM